MTPFERTRAINETLRRSASDAADEIAKIVDASISEAMQEAADEERERCAGEIARLQADADRLDWLERCSQITWEQVFNRSVFRRISIRQAIDAVRGKA